MSTLPRWAACSDMHPAMGLAYQTTLSIACFFPKVKREPIKNLMLWSAVQSLACLTAT